MEGGGWRVEGGGWKEDGLHLVGIAHDVVSIGSEGVNGHLADDVVVAVGPRPVLLVVIDGITDE